MDINLPQFIETSPDICHGQPVFKGTRVMVYLVLEMLAAGESVEDILKDYPSLTVDHIHAAYWFAARMTERSRMRSLDKPLIA